VRIYDLSGRLVRNFDGVRAQGSFEPAAEWDGRDENGREVAPGLYVIRVESSNGAGTAKISLVR
jgi:flagellar hook assembly protein FlgD